MHRETATELSVLRQWISIVSAECESHYQVLSLARYGGFLFRSVQEFMIFILIAGLHGTEQIILNRRIFSPTFTSLTQRSSSVLAVFVHSSNFLL